jgi:ABC-type amino acid transport system permease subunit
MLIKILDELEGKHHQVQALIKTIAITAAMTVIAGLIGFGIGIALLFLTSSYAALLFFHHYRSQYVLEAE